MHDCHKFVNNSRKWEKLGRTWGEGLPTCILVYEQYLYLLLLMVWCPDVPYDSTHTLATHSESGTMFEQLILQGQEPQSEERWAEKDRNFLQLGLAPMLLLSITLSHHFVFARGKKERVSFISVTFAAWKLSGTFLCDLKPNLRDVIKQIMYMYCIL